MILLTLHGIEKSYPTGPVLSGIDWQIKSGEKIALLGKNGTGKSTLLAIASARMEADRGERTIGRGVTIGTLDQIPDRNVDTSLFDYVIAARSDILDLRRRIEALANSVSEYPDRMELQTRLDAAQAELERIGGYDLERSVEIIIGGLGFTTAQYGHRVDHLSGGERTRVELARLLLKPVDLLLLDEPTNHLDIAAVEWLEEFLSDSHAAVVLVTHDRVFLERFAGHVVELAHHRLEHYHGDYRNYRKEKPLRHQRAQKAYELQQAEIARIEDFIVRNIAGQKTKQAQSRRKALAKWDRLDKPLEDSASITLGFTAAQRSFREVLTVSDYTKLINGRTLLSHVSFVCERGDKIGVIGPNGSGKTTLLRALVGLDSDYDGTIRIGERVEPVYFDQHLASLDAQGRVIDEIWNVYPHFEAGPLRSYLARFLFSGDDVFKSVTNLSGGEKNRLALAKLMLSEANLLVLDEPTNHLDVAAREVLEVALAEFDGTAIVVSHDRRFLDRFANKILNVADGTVSLSLGHYSDWAARRDRVGVVVEKKTTSKSVAAVDWEDQKRIRSAKRKRDRQRKALESDIAAAERRLEQIDAELTDEQVARDWQRLAALTEERQEMDAKLTDLLEKLE